LPRRRIVEPLLPNDAVERTNRVVIDWWGKSDVIMVCADRDIRVAELWISAAKNRDDIVRRRFRRALDKRSMSAQRTSRGAEREILQRLREDALGRTVRD
jgi:hypothetical protein